ncbi:unnamed protein product, partial [Didymodactylos carnosus]
MGGTVPVPVPTGLGPEPGQKTLFYRDWDRDGTTNYFSGTG